MRAVLDRRHDLTLGGRVGAELVGDHSPGWAALLAQETPQQALGRRGVAAGLDDLVEVPDVAAAWRLAPETAGVRGPELQRPAADRLIGDENAALEQHLFDQPQAQRKPEVQPDCMGDDLRRKAVALVAVRSDDIVSIF